MIETHDTLIMLTVKLVLLIAFIYSLKYWFDKKNSIIPVIIYWLLGLVFVLLVSFLIFEWLLISAFNTEEYSPLAAILGIIFYIYVGLKKFRKQR